ncbi:hypothetical protein TIFTF001_026956 [Ficus carica]|uniref:MULE transposase domain-containing protein n=1 Tax=Ficus carica TaxID=3494 RepID=A0AA88DMB1_FICCA|nr:hypothetical protein TIFTF001_026956 [Ficus carica]
MPSNEGSIGLFQVEENPDPAIHQELAHESYIHQLPSFDPYAQNNNDPALPLEFDGKQSDKTRILLSCHDNKCKWCIRATRCNNTEMFKVTRYINTHTCSLDELQIDHRQATSSFISNTIRRKYKKSVKVVYAPNNIIEDMKEEYGIDVSYRKAWKAKELALEYMQDEPDDSYQELPAFLYMVTKTNPGSRTDVKTNSENWFLYMFMAFGALILGWMHCRPVVVVDGTLLKCIHGGSLLTACAKDTNDQIFPLAFRTGDSENDESWDYFFKHLRDSYGERDGLWIISNRHKSTHKNAAKWFPNAMLGYYKYHLTLNLKNRFPSVARALTRVGYI